MKAVAPGTVIFHRHRGYGVITHVNLLTGWISARFGSESRTLDLNLSSDEVQHADGEAILFRRAPPDRMPHARLMAMVRPWREGWYGSGADYNNNPVMGWGDTPGASTEELIHALARFDPQGLARALGRDEDHTAWFEGVCHALLPGYMYSLDMERATAGGLHETPPVPVIPVRAGLAPYDGPAIGWPPGWAGLWTRTHVMPAPKITIPGIKPETETSEE
jgi:hypothetical protein